MTPEMELLREIQITQVIILSKLFDIEKKVKSGGNRTLDNYTVEAARMIKNLRPDAEQALSHTP